MPNWTCGAEGCGLHANPDDRCSGRAWRCLRRRPACGSHGRREDRCPRTDSDLWSCGATGCPGRHSDPDHHCTGRHWGCRVVNPPCPGHAAPGHACTVERATVREAALCAPGRSASSPALACPAAARVEVVEFVEVVRHNNSDSEHPVDGRRQYINLDDSVDPSRAHKEYGRELRFKARVAWQSGSSGRSLEDFPVYFYATPGRHNRSGLTSTAQGGFTSASSGQLRLSVRAQTDGWTPVISFWLSEYGGDQFEIHATHDARYRDGIQAGPYIVWKRLWYEIAEMERPGGGRFEMPAASVSTIVRSYRRVFIEMLNAGGRSSGSHQANFPTHAAGYTWADAMVNGVGSPWKVHYAVVDHVVPLANRQRRDFDLTVTQAISEPASTSFRPYDYNGQQWLIQAEFELAGVLKPIATGAVTLASGSRPTALRIDLSGMQDANPSAANPVRVKIAVYEAPGYNGWGGANLHLLICRGAMEGAYTTAQLPAIIAGTGIHEPGHALGLVYGGRPWVSTSHANHCRYRRCVMWWQGYVGRPHDFHLPGSGANRSDPGCHTFLRGKNMSRTNMSSWRFPRSP